MGDFPIDIVRGNIEMNPVPLAPRTLHEVEAKPGSRTFDHDGGVGLGRETEVSKARDLLIVVWRDLVPFERGRPEPRERGWVVSIDDDVLQTCHERRMQSMGRTTQ